MQPAAARLDAAIGFHAQNGCLNPHIQSTTRLTITARHKTQATLSVLPKGYGVEISAATPSLVPELARSFPAWVQTACPSFVVGDEASLAALLRRAARLARTLPNEAATTYEQAVSDELAALPESLQGTEVERVIRQRVGQQKFREAMLDYWGCACAVSGIAVREVLRASHAKPWAECTSDAERLDVFNGFLLSANLDALFDRFLISFDPQGNILISNALSEADRALLGLSSGLRLRWFAVQHERYLSIHRLRLIA